MLKQEQDAYAILIVIIIVAVLYSFAVVVDHSYNLYYKFDKMDNTKKVFYSFSAGASIIILLFSIFGGAKSLTFFRKMINNKNRLFVV